MGEPAEIVCHAVVVILVSPLRLGVEVLSFNRSHWTTTGWFTASQRTWRSPTIFLVSAARGGKKWSRSPDLRMYGMFINKCMHARLTARHGRLKGENRFWKKGFGFFLISLERWDVFLGSSDAIFGQLSPDEMGWMENGNDPFNTVDACSKCCSNINLKKMSFVATIILTSFFRQTVSLACSASLITRMWCPYSFTEMHRKEIDQHFSHKSKLIPLSLPMQMVRFKQMDMQNEHRKSTMHQGLFSMHLFTLHEFSVFFVTLTKMQNSLI